VQPDQDCGERDGLGGQTGDAGAQKAKAGPCSDTPDQYEIHRHVQRDTAEGEGCRGPGAVDGIQHLRHNHEDRDWDQEACHGEPVGAGGIQHFWRLTQQRQEEPAGTHQRRSDQTGKAAEA